MSEKQAEPKTRLVVHDDGPLAHMFDTAKFEQTWRIATAIAAATLLPDHLRLNMKTKQPLEAKQVQSNILRIVNQAIRWQVDPYAVVDCTYVVANKLGYEGKLVAGVVNARAGLKGRLGYEFTGAGNDRTVTVSGTFDDETEVRTIELSVGQAKTTNKMWTTDPDQKLVYSGATKWARRHCPEIMLGVLTDHDLEVIADGSGSTIATLSVTDDKPPLSQVIKAAAAEAKADEPEPEPDASGDVVDMRVKDYEELYKQAETVDEVDTLDAQVKADPVVAAKPYQEMILGDHDKSFSRKARLP